MKELWKKIKENEEYEISNYGNFRRNGIPFKTSEYEANRPSKRKSRTVALKINGKYKSFQVSRLVAKYFLKNPENKELVFHIDHNSLNNRVDNLKWISYKELDELFGRYKEKPIYMIKDNDLFKRFNSIKECAEWFNINGYPNTKIINISLCLRGINKTHHDYSFIYAKEIEEDYNYEDF